MCEPVGLPVFLLEVQGVVMSGKEGDSVKWWGKYFLMAEAVTLNKARICQCDQSLMCVCFFFVFLF